MRTTVLLSMTVACCLLGAGSLSAKPVDRLSSAAADVPGYVIGPDDVLEIAFFQDKDLGREVVVRPDGNIALPVLGEIAAAGLTPAELTARLKERASDILESPLPTVAVKQINSRKVFITGEVVRPGRYPLIGPTSVLELIAMAGGLTQYADRKNIGIVRKSDGAPITFKFNYNKAAKLQNLQDNITLLSGDIVVVP